MEPSNRKGLGTTSNSQYENLAINGGVPKSYGGAPSFHLGLGFSTSKPSSYEWSPPPIYRTYQESFWLRETWRNLYFGNILVILPWKGSRAPRITRSCPSHPQVTIVFNTLVLHDLDDLGYIPHNLGHLPSCLRFTPWRSRRMGGKSARWTIGFGDSSIILQTKPQKYEVIQAGLSHLELVLQALWNNTATIPPSQYETTPE